MTAVQLGSIAIRDAVKKSGIAASEFTEALIGNVLSANIGQAPARQAVLGAGLPVSVPATTINRVCASGLKATSLAAQTILTGQNEVVLSGGMESMSNVPYLLEGRARRGLGIAHPQILDGILRDGLIDAYDNKHMGTCADKCARDHSISRADQDAYALESFARAINAAKAGFFESEIAAVEIVSAKGSTVVREDDGPKTLKADKVPTLKPAFGKDGTATAANSSSINDGAAALVLVSADYARKHGLRALAAVKSFADGAQEPVNFTTAPALVFPRALKLAGLTVNDIDLWEINEAFSVVALANMQLMGLDHAKVNVFGGAVALGHPIGCSGARIIVTLLHAMLRRNAALGAAGICNGGGGASTIILERLE